jgi:hypothetical protein
MIFVTFSFALLLLLLLPLAVYYVPALSRIPFKIAPFVAAGKRHGSEGRKGIKIAPKKSLM